MRHIHVRILLVLFLAATAAFAQPKFDAASVKPNLLDDHIVAIDPGPGGHFAARGYTLKLLIQYAYNVKGWQISGGPGWLDDDRYDVTARGADDATPAQLRQMLQALLADRFALRVHTVEREMPGFELTVANGGPKMKRSSATQDNDQMMHEQSGKHALVANGISMASFAKIVGAYVSKPVVDKTGLTGLYEFKVLWTERADQVPDASADPGVSILEALRDQLGLKLKSKRVPAEVIVIDGAEKASGN